MDNHWLESTTHRKNYLRRATFSVTKQLNEKFRHAFTWPFLFRFQICHLCILKTKYLKTLSTQVKLTRRLQRIQLTNHHLQWLNKNYLFHPKTVSMKAQLSVSTHLRTITWMLTTYLRERTKVNTNSTSRNVSVGKASTSSGERFSTNANPFAMCLDSN